MTEELIPNYHKEQIERAIIDKGLDLSKFDWDIAESDNIPNIKDRPVSISDQYDVRRLRPQLKISKLVYKNTEYHFTFDFYGENGLWSERRPGSNRLIEGNSFSSWEDRKAYALEWLDILAKELNARDLMAEFAKSKQLLESGINASVENTPITPEERGAILSQLDEIQRYLIEHIEQQKLSDERSGIFQDQVKQEIAYIKEATNRLGRKDWILLALGNAIAIVTNTFFSPEFRPVVFRYFVDLVNYLANGRIYLPPIL